MSKVFIAMFVLLTPLAHAQAPVPPIAPVAPVAPSFPIASFDLSDDAMMFVSSELGGRSVIKGAPYAATAVNETRQELSDGNRIERSSTVKLYRDSQGRTRQEQAGSVVFINDVVAGKSYVLNTQRRSAREMRVAPRPPAPPIAAVPPVPPTPPAAAVPPPAPPANVSGDEARSWAEEMRRWARDFSERMRGEQRVIVTRSAVAGERSQFTTEHVEVIRLNDAQAAAPSVFPMMPVPGAGATTALGQRDVDGVRAQGTKTTWTIAAGRVGNKLPIDIVSERWHSPELNVVVLTRYADPRSGERIYRLENITRDEPNAELFKVPADYALKTAPVRDSERK